MDDSLVEQSKPATTHDQLLTLINSYEIAKTV